MKPPKVNRPMWLMVGACLTIPCCTPLYIGVLIALLAGTPAAIWISQHQGWIYGALTLLSVTLFALGWRGMAQRKPHTARRPNSTAAVSPSSETTTQLTRSESHVR